MKLAAILLAAGASSRYGSPKQLARLDGVSLVRRAALAILETGAELLVVSGAHAEAVAAELAGLPLRVVANAAWAEGMGSSIGCGFRELLRQPHPAPATLLCLVDQPLIGAPELRRLLAAHEAAPERIVVSDHGDVRGPPCLFPVEFYPELAALRGPDGARAVLERHADEVTAAALPEAAVDIDTEQDWEAVKRLKGME